MRNVTWMVVGVLTTAMTAGPAARQLQTPADWKWRTDTPAKVSNDVKASDDAVYFVAMPPGWHVTTGPGSLLYHPTNDGKGNFTLEMEVFVFPESTVEEYGLFVSGRDLEPATATPLYTAFVVRRDGQAAVLRRGGSPAAPLVPWTRHDAVLPPTAKDATKNVLRLALSATEAVFSANGTTLAKVPRTEIADGRFGFRVGKGVNLHISRLDATYHLAPVRKNP